MGQSGVDICPCGVWRAVIRGVGKGMTLYRLGTRRRIMGMHRMENVAAGIDRPPFSCDQPGAPRYERAIDLAGTWTKHP